MSALTKPPPGTPSAPYDMISGAAESGERRYTYGLPHGSSGTYFRYGPFQPLAPGSNTRALSPAPALGYSPQSALYCSSAFAIASNCRVAYTCRVWRTSLKGWAKKPSRTTPREIAAPSPATSWQRGVQAGATMIARYRKSLLRDLTPHKTRRRTKTPIPPRLPRGQVAQLDLAGRCAGPCGVYLHDVTAPSLHDVYNTH